MPAEMFCIGCDLFLFEQLFSPHGGKPTLAGNKLLPSKDGENVLSASNQALALRLGPNPLWVRLDAASGTSGTRNPLRAEDQDRR